MSIAEAEEEKVTQEEEIRHIAKLDDTLMGQSFIEESKLNERLLIPTISYQSSKYEDANGFRDV